MWKREMKFQIWFFFLMGLNFNIVFYFIYLGDVATHQDKMDDVEVLTCHLTANS